MCNVTIQSCNSLEENLEILQKNKWQIVLLYDNIFLDMKLKKKMPIYLPGYIYTKM